MSLLTFSWEFSIQIKTTIFSRSIVKFVLFLVPKENSILSLNYCPKNEILGIGTEFGSIQFWKIERKSEDKQLYLSKSLVVEEKGKISDISIDPLTKNVVVAGSEKVLFLELRNNRKLAPSLQQKMEKILNRVRWTDMGKVLMVEIGGKRASAYVYSNEFPIWF